MSGNYWINTTTGVHQVYCDMELECGGHKGDWMRIADLDTSRGDYSPSGWTKVTSNASGIVNLALLPQHVQAMHFLLVILCGMEVGVLQLITIVVQILICHGFVNSSPYHKKMILK